MVPTCPGKATIARGERDAAGAVDEDLDRSDVGDECFGVPATHVPEDTESADER